LLSGEPGLPEKFDAAGEVFVCPVVIGELFFGAANSSRRAENTAKIKALLADMTTLDWSQKVGETYAETKISLKRTGKPIPENDLWIASFALAYGLSLVARDTHFDAIQGLKIERW
jgi:tRNA(fMet)-specific endonuclease VapC